MLAAAAVARQKTRAVGSSYDGLNLASFRGSSELEFGADACYLLDREGAGGAVLRCAKNRYGEAADVPRAFDRRFPRFDAAGGADPLTAFDAAAPAGPRRGLQVRKVTMLQVREELGGVRPPDAARVPDMAGEAPSAAGQPGGPGCRTHSGT